MQKQEFKEKMEQEKQKKQAQLDAMPILGMATIDYGEGKPKFRLQIVKLTKRTVTVKTINGKGTISLSTSRAYIRDIVEIEVLPCNTTPSVTLDGETKKIPQGSDVPM